MRIRSGPRADAQGFLGLARRAGATVLGVEGVRKALREDRAFLVILAEDAAPGQLAKLEGLLSEKEIPVRWMERRDMLAQAMGRASISAVAITTRSFAEQLLSRLPAGSLPGAAPVEGGQGPKEEVGTDAGR